MKSHTQGSPLHLGGEEHEDLPQSSGLTPAWQGRSAERGLLCPDCHLLGETKLAEFKDTTLKPPSISDYMHRNHKSLEFSNRKSKHTSGSTKNRSKIAE